MLFVHQRHIVAEHTATERSARELRTKLVRAALDGVVHELAEFDGVNMHAEVAIDGRDRQRLEHVFLALHGAQKRSDEHLGRGLRLRSTGCHFVTTGASSIASRTPGAMARRSEATSTLGTHAVVLSPADFIARLCALCRRRAFT